MAYKENYPSKLLEEAVDAISTLPGVDAAVRFVWRFTY